MDRQGHNGVKFFVGSEVEQTPAAGKKTLFVVGEQPINTILKHAREHRVQHVYMGANHSFVLDVNNFEYWDKTIIALLNAGYWTTLDYEAHNHRDLRIWLSNTIWESRLFVPLLSVRIPHLEKSNSNLTIKIDDIDFEATNPGVWCIHVNQLTDSNRFTGWGEYGTDQVIDAPVENVVPEVVIAEEVSTVETPSVPVELNDNTAGLDLAPHPEVNEPVENTTQVEVIEAVKEATITDIPVKKAKAHKAEVKDDGNV